MLWQSDEVKSKLLLLNSIVTINEPGHRFILWDFHVSLVTWLFVPMSISYCHLPFTDWLVEIFYIFGVQYFVSYYHCKQLIPDRVLFHIFLYGIFWWAVVFKIVLKLSFICWVSFILKYSWRNEAKRTFVSFNQFPPMATTWKTVMQFLYTASILTFLWLKYKALSALQESLPFIAVSTSFSSTLNPWQWLLCYPTLWFCHFKNII